MRRGGGILVTAHAGGEDVSVAVVGLRAGFIESGASDESGGFGSKGQAMAGNPHEGRPRTHGPHGPRVGRPRVPGAGWRRSSADPDVERQGFDEAEQANAQADDERETRFVSWQDLERVADEAADIDAVVRSELEAVGERRAIDDEAPSGPVRPPSRRGLRAGTILVVLLAAVAGAAFVIAGNKGEQPHPRATSAISPTASAAPTTQPSSDSPPPVVVPPKAIVARLSFSTPCWVNAVADGRSVFTGTIPDGSRTIRAKRMLLLTLGNAGGVDLLVNGRRVTTGATGEVMHLSFALEGGKVTELPA